MCACTSCFLAFTNGYCCVCGTFAYERGITTSVDTLVRARSGALSQLHHVFVCWMLRRRRTGRKRARMRAKRMTGQGLNPATGLPFAKHDPYKDPTRLVNPWEDSRQRGRADSPERSAQKGHTTAVAVGSATGSKPS
jgi:hypothetical protein